VHGCVHGGAVGKWAVESGSGGRRRVAVIVVCLACLGSTEERAGCSIYGCTSILHGLREITYLL